MDRFLLNKVSQCKDKIERLFTRIYEQELTIVSMASRNKSTEEENKMLEQTIKDRQMLLENIRNKKEELFFKVQELEEFADQESFRDEETPSELELSTYAETRSPRLFELVKKY